MVADEPSRGKRLCPIKVKLMWDIIDAYKNGVFLEPTVKSRPAPATANGLRHTEHCAVEVLHTTDVTAYSESEDDSESEVDNHEEWLAVSSGEDEE